MPDGKLPALASLFFKVQHPLIAGMVRTSSAQRGHDGPIDAGSARVLDNDLWGFVLDDLVPSPQELCWKSPLAPSERGLSRWEERSPPHVIEISERPNRLSYGFL